MAWTVTRFKTVFGDKATVGLKIVADSATSVVASGLKHIDWFSYGPASMGTSNVRIGINVTASSAAESQGTIAVTGAASGDEFYLTVYGTR